jgi:hypothetical protein
MTVPWVLISNLTPIGAIRALWFWRGYKYAWFPPTTCLILWLGGLSLWVIGLVPFWLGYVIGMILSWLCFIISTPVLKFTLQRHIYARWEAGLKLRSAWPHLANLLIAKRDNPIAREILTEAMQCFEYVQSVSPFVREFSRPKPLRLVQPPSMQIEGWFGLAYGERSEADPKYLALGPEIEEAIGNFYNLCSGPL